MLPGTYKFEVTNCQNSSVGLCGAVPRWPARCYRPSGNSVLTYSINQFTLSAASRALSLCSEKRSCLLCRNASFQPTPTCTTCRIDTAPIVVSRMQHRHSTVSYPLKQIDLRCLFLELCSVCCAVVLIVPDHPIK